MGLSDFLLNFIPKVIRSYCCDRTLGCLLFYRICCYIVIYNSYRTGRDSQIKAICARHPNNVKNDQRKKEWRKIVLDRYLLHTHRCLYVFVKFDPTYHTECINHLIYLHFLDLGNAFFMKKFQLIKIYRIINYKFKDF